MSTDHKTEAFNYLLAATIDTHGDDDRKVAIAQVHATLALVEEQRITNELRAAELMVDSPWLRSEIERLGLAND